jgi:diadenosine tetraphosphate (Ap4A) HIT family hydrolase
MKKEDRKVAPENAGTDEYAEVLRRIEARGECPFCIKNLLKEHPEGPIRTGQHWFLIKNQFSYPQAKQRFVLIAKVHAENLSDLPREAMEEALEFFRFIQEKFDITYGSIAMRFGDPSRTGGTVNHLHFHIVQPHDPKTPGYKPVRFRIGGRTP